MGNEASSSARLNGGMPQMVLYLDTLMIWSGQALEPEVDPKKPTANGTSSSSSSSTIPSLVDSQTLFARVLVDGCEVRGGRVDRFPSLPIPIQACSPESELQLEFFVGARPPCWDKAGNGASSDPIPWSTVVAPVSRLLAFGAPLYTSMWLGLARTEGFGGDRSAYTNFFDALQHAHLPNAEVPKVKFTMFKPSLNDAKFLQIHLKENTLASWNPKPDVKTFFGAGSTGLDCVEPGGNKVTKSNVSQLEGLLRCVRESNSIVNKLQTAAVGVSASQDSIAEDRSNVNRMLHEIKRINREFEDSERRWSAEGFESAPAKLRSQIEDERERHNDEKIRLSNAHAEAIKSKEEELKSMRQATQASMSRLEDRHKAALADLHRGIEDIEKTASAKVSSARLQWGVQVDKQLKEANEAGKRRFEHACIQKQETLDAQRRMLNEGVTLLQVEIQDARAKLAAVLGQKEGLEVEVKEMDAGSKDFSAAEEARMRTMREESHREFQSLLSESLEEQEDRRVKIQILKVQLEEARQNKGEVLSKAEQELMTELATMQAEKALARQEKQLQRKTEEAELVSEQQAHLERERQDWQTKCEAHEKQLVTLRALVDDQGQDVLLTTDELGQLEREATVLTAEFGELQTERQGREKEIKRVVSENAVKVSSAQSDLNDMLSEYDRVISELQKAQAEELATLAADRGGVLAECEAQRNSLRRDLEEQREQSSQRFFDIIKQWEQKCKECSEETTQVDLSRKHLEETASESSEKRRADLAERLAASEARSNEEVSEIQEQLDYHTRNAEEESARLSTELVAVKEEMERRQVEIAEDLKRDLEQHRSMLETEHQQRYSVLVGRLQQIESDRDSSIEKQKEQLGEILAPLAAEVERLRKEVMHLPEAERENRCMLQELASEAAMVDVALSAHGDAEAMLASRCAAVKTIEDEISTLKEDQSRIDQQIKDSQRELVALYDAHNESLAAVHSDRDRALRAAKRQIGDLEQRVNARKREFEATRKVQIGELEQRLSEEKALLESKLANLQAELEYDKATAARAQAVANEKAQADVEDQALLKQKTLEEVREAQEAVEALRSESDEELRNQKRELEAKVAAVQVKARQEVLRLLQESRQEHQNAADSQQSIFSRLQAAHASEKEHLQKLVADQEAIGASLRSQLAKSEKEADDASAVVAHLQKEISALHDQHACDMQTTMNAQESALANERRLAKERQVRLQSGNEEEEQQILQKVSTARAEADQLRSDLQVLQAACERQKLAALTGAERSSIEKEQLKDRLQVLDAAIASERLRNADRLARREQEAITHKNSYESATMNCKIEQERLQRKLDTLLQEKEVSLGRLKAASADVEGQEKQLEYQQQLEAEGQERNFQQQRRHRESQHQTDLEAQQEAQRLALEALKTSNQAELQRIQAARGALRKQLEEMEELPHQVQALRVQLNGLQEQNAALQQAMKKAARQSVEEHQQEVKKLESLQESRLEEAHAHFAAVLAQHKRSADAARKDLEEQMRRERDNFLRKMSAHEGNIESQKADQMRVQAEFDRQLEKEVKELERESSVEIDKLNAQLEKARADQESLNKARRERENELRQSMDAEVRDVASNADAKVAEARDAEIKIVELEMAEELQVMEEKVKTAETENRKIKEELQSALQDLTESRAKEVEFETIKAEKDADSVIEVQQDLENQLAVAQAYLNQIQLDLDEKTKIHELALQEKSQSETAQIEKTRRNLRSEQSNLISELSEAQKYSQDALRQMQDECFATIDRVRQEAHRDAEKRLKEGTSKIRIDLWQAQQTYNVWQKRLDKVTRELAELGFTDSINIKSDPPETHPLEYVLNRILIRIFRGLLEEKQSIVDEEDMRMLFNMLSKAGGVGEYRLVTHEEFKDAIKKGLSCPRAFDLKKFVRLMDQTTAGCVAAKDWESRCQASLGLDRETIAHIYHVAENGARSDKKYTTGGVPRKSSPGAIHEDDLVNFLDYPSIRRIFDFERGDDDVDDVSRMSESRLSCSSKGCSISTPAGAAYADLGRQRLESAESSVNSARSPPKDTSRSPLDGKSGTRRSFRDDTSTQSVSTMGQSQSRDALSGYPSHSSSRSLARLGLKGDLSQSSTSLNRSPAISGDSGADAKWV